MTWPIWKNNWESGKFLPLDYDSSEAPAEPGGMDVASTVYVLNISAHSEEHARISMRVQYVLCWYDPRLFGLAPGWVLVPPALLWSPPLAFGRTVRRASTEEDDDNKMWINQDGLIILQITRLLQVTCVAKLARYPLDTQVCSVALLGYNGIRYRLQPSTLPKRAPIKSDATGVVSQFTFIGVEERAVFKSFITNGTNECVYLEQDCDYRLEECMTSLSDECTAGSGCGHCYLIIGDCLHQLQTCPRYLNDTSAFTSLEVHVRLRRVLWRYILTAYLPSTVVVSASYLQTWLSPTQAAISPRIVLGVMSVLTMIKQMGKTARMPWVDEPRAIDIWMLGCLSFVIVVLLETAVAHFLSLSMQEKEKKEIRAEELERERNPPVQIPRPGLRDPSGWTHRPPEHLQNNGTLFSQPISIPRARLYNPSWLKWHQMADNKEWVIVIKENGTDLKKEDDNVWKSRDHADSPTVSYTPPTMTSHTMYTNVPAFDARTVGPTQECQMLDGTSYRGLVSMTVANKTCQSWGSQTPHQHSYTPTAYPSSGLQQNYCRNPSGDTAVWCYTSDPAQRWAYCDVPVCDLACTGKTTGILYIYNWDLPPATSPYFFLVRAPSDVHIALANSNNFLTVLYPMYELVIGGWGNARSAIRRGAQGVNMISLATGEWTDPEPLPVSYFGYSTGFGNPGDWQFCEGGMDVSSSVYILNIGTLSEKNANISVRIQYTLSWADYRLFGIAQSWVPVPPALVWSPPLGFGQSVRRVIAEEEGDTAMWMDPRGMVTYKMTYASDMIIRVLTVSCVARLERYPLDTQVCRVVLHAYNGIRLRLQSSRQAQSAPIKVDARGIRSQFILVGAEQKAGFKSFRENATDTGATTWLEVDVRLRRVLWRYILTYYLPSTVVVLAAFLQTWLPLTLSTVSARVVLGTTAVLSMIIQAGKTVQMPWRQ
ncbi:PREDICTED: uncharacterized protein LOC109482840 [Branchiostoma belcheri]|uniref:Uncharacterized protein LOC109482840 n=1 Tax=Branchiostoma belcheri TaxID=7741 RepID=A0A6P5AHC2_BRABE|nr:PREDICTED: uncharacterized protein LOC109482840 [Branchiostoma belcheri]